MRCQNTIFFILDVEEKIWIFANNHSEISAVQGKEIHKCHLRSLWDDMIFCCWCIISSSDRIEDLVVLGFPIHIKSTLESSSNKQTLLHIYPKAKNCQLLEQLFFRSSCWSDETNWTLLRAHPCICQNKWSFIWVVRFVLSILLSVGYRMHIVHTYMY